MASEKSDAFLFMKNKKVIISLAGIVSIFLLLVIDQYSKSIATIQLKGRHSISIIKNVLEFAYVENKGAAFGIFSDATLFFIIVSILFSIVAIFYYVYLPLTNRFIPMRIILIFVISGAVGNLIDRITNHYVIDFIYVKVINFPVFNIADIYVTCSIFVFALLMIFYYKDDDLKYFRIRK